MAFEALLLNACPIHKKREPMEVMRLAKIRTTLEHFGELFEQNPKAPRDSRKQRVGMPFPVKVGLFKTTNELSMAELKAAAARIDKKASKCCPECPLNVANDLIGCYTAVNYPISAVGEEWFLQQFDPPEGQMSYLPHHIRDNEVPFNALAQFRNDPASGRSSLFERLTPVERPVRNALGDPDGDVTSDQIFSYLFNCKPFLIPPTCLGVLVDFRVLRANLDAIRLANVLMMGGMAGLDKVRDFINESFEVSQETLEPVEGEDRSIHQLKAFLYFCYLSLMTGAPLVVDG